MRSATTADSEPVSANVGRVRLPRANPSRKEMRDAIAANASKAKEGVPLAAAG